MLKNELPVPKCLCSQSNFLDPPELILFEFHQTGINFQILWCSTISGFPRRKLC